MSTNPLDTLMCSQCPHSATQHGFVMDLVDWSISHTVIECKECGCESFTQPKLPEMHLDPDRTLIPLE